MNDESPSRRYLKADLHVHSFYSGYSPSLPLFRSRDSYSDPDQIYRLAKARGMDLVTITDHDSIDGCLDFLNRRPDTADFIIGEEIGCRLPDGDITIHVGAFGIDERIHREIQPLRDNAYDVAALLRRERVPFCLNHPFMYYRGQLELSRYIATVASHFSGMEARNGAMLSAHNALVERMIDDVTLSGTCVARFGGSDAHLLRRVGTTYTEAAGSSPREFLESLKSGRSRVGGRHGGTGVLAIEIYGVIFNHWSSLLGMRSEDLVGRERLRDLGLSALSVPFQFIPFLVAAGKKASEARRLSALSRRWLAFVKTDGMVEKRAALSLDPAGR